MANDSTLRGGFEAKNDRAHLAVSAAGRPLPIRVTGIRCQPKKADEKKPPEKIRRFLYSGGVWLTVCRLASRAYEQWCGLLRNGAEIP
ncbi:hypothetical protein [Castellaniella sp. MT123]|uniref:hypothetical protein n=1 Tax=Castellaniella sp. MT123 TaxID=3140381 RepID=UPI0031F3D0E9